MYMYIFTQGIHSQPMPPPVIPRRGLAGGRLEGGGPVERGPAEEGSSRYGLKPQVGLCHDSWAYANANRHEAKTITIQMAQM